MKKQIEFLTRLGSEIKWETVEVESYEKGTVFLKDRMFERTVWHDADNDRFFMCVGGWYEVSYWREGIWEMI